MGGNGRIWALWRETEAQELLFFANTSGERITAQVEVMSQVASWENWSLESGERTAFEAQIEDGKSRFALDLPPYGSALLVSSKSGAPVSRLEEDASPAPPIPLGGEWNLKLDRPNALRLNRWKAASSDENFSAPEADDENWTEIEALPLRFREPRGVGWKNQIERRIGEAVWYRRRIEAQFVPENLEILVENGAILGDWTLFVNGVEVPQAAFAPREYNGEDKIAASVARYFKTGGNVLALKVENTPELGGLLTLLHLIGDFALVGENQRTRTLAPLPQTARFNHLVGAGLPHFSGCATYSRVVDLSSAQTLQLPSDFGEIAHTRVANHDLGARAWSPYHWTLPNDATGTVNVEIEIAVTNTLLPFVEGQTWNAESGAAHNF